MRRRMLAQGHGVLLQGSEVALGELDDAVAFAEYALRMPGLVSSVRISTDPLYYEQHADTVELWSPGNPTFPAPATDAAPEGVAPKNLAALLDSLQVGLTSQC